MKRFTLYVCILLAVFISCSKEEYSPGALDIQFQFEILPIDLNVVDNPFITCIIRSETGLKSVQMFIEDTDGDREQYKMDITEFFNPRHCSLHERPVYSDEMAAFIIKAVDLGGAVLEGRLGFDVKKKVNAPVITLKTEEISFKEGEPVPEFGFEVSSDSDLSSVKVEIIQSATSSELVPVFEEFDDARFFSFLSSDYDLNQYDYNKIPQAVRIIVEDDYGKSSIGLINIKYKELPAPALTMNTIDGPIDEFSSVRLSGNAKSETGISKFEVYAVGEEYESLACRVGGLESSDYNLSVEVPGVEIRDFITEIKVVVYDKRNKKTEAMLPVVINPVFEQISATADLVEEISKRFGDSRCRNVKLLLPEGASYNMNEALVISKTLKLKSTKSADLPVVNVSSAYTFLTNNASVDVVSFENVIFKTTKSGSFFMGNDAEPCSIGSLTLTGCVLDGYTNAFYRTGKQADIGSLKIDDCQLKWKNASSSYSFLHFTQGTGTLSEVRLSNSTFNGVLYLHYNNLTATNCHVDVSNCTFVDSKASEASYFMFFANSSLKGTVRLKKLLFAGSNNLKDKYRMLRPNNLTTELEDNYCTKSWKTFVDDATNNSMNFCTVLCDMEDNDQIFMDYQNGDYSIRKSTTVYDKGIGDPRWLK